MSRSKYDVKLEIIYILKETLEEKVTTIWYCVLIVDARDFYS